MRESISILLLAGCLSAQEAKSQKELFERTCSACHTVANATSARRTKGQWQGVIREMIDQQGAAIPDDAVPPILDYLVTTYGKVKVNAAPADELVQVLGLTPGEADAIVKGRPFENFEALAKVSGVDPKKLERNRDAIAF